MHWSLCEVWPMYGRVMVDLYSGRSSGGRLGLGWMRLNFLYPLSCSDVLMWWSSCFKLCWSQHFYKNQRTSSTRQTRTSRQISHHQTLTRTRPPHHLARHQTYSYCQFLAPAQSQRGHRDPVTLHSSPRHWFLHQRHLVTTPQAHPSTSISPQHWHTPTHTHPASSHRSSITEHPASETFPPKCASLQQYLSLYTTTSPAFSWRRTEYTVRNVETNRLFSEPTLLTKEI